MTCSTTGCRGIVSGPGFLVCDRCYERALAAFRRPHVTARNAHVIERERVPLPHLT